MLNRWLRGPGARGPGGGDDSEIRRGSNWAQAEEGRAAELPWRRRRRRQQQQRFDVVKGKRPEVWSGLGSSSEPAESDKAQVNKPSSKVYPLEGKRV